MFKIDYDYNSHLGIQSSGNPSFQKVLPIYEGVGSIPEIFKEGKKIWVLHWILIEIILIK